MSMLEKALEKADEKKISIKNDTFVDVIENSEDIRVDELSTEAAIQPEKIKADVLLEPIIKNESQDIIRFNWDYLKEHGFIQLDDLHSQISEEYRNIKRPLVTNAVGSRKSEIENSNLILVTSSVPNEGKTFTAINLAFSIATELDKEVLLIDADVAKPSFEKVLGIKSDIGLIDFLETDDLTLSDIILQTEIPGLRIITAGKSHKLSTELLASNKMIALSKELSERYADRIVIFDTPPLLATTQAEVLASQMGQIVLVVGAESTSKGLINESAKKLQRCPGVVLSILNKASAAGSGSYGYGHY